MAYGHANIPDKQINRRGFTIVELLIVIVVIAILAAITIVAYNGIQNRAKTSAVQSAVSQATKKVMSHAVINSDQYPATLAEVDIFDSADITYQYSVNNSVSPRTFGITATNGTFSYFASNANTTPTAGGYPGHSANGVSAITNLSPNPSAELDAGTFGGWSGTGGASAQVRETTGGAHTGTAFMRRTWTTAGGGGGIAQVIPATPAGTILTTSAWVRASKAVTISCNWQNGGVSAQSFPLVANTWTRVSCTGTVPVGQTTTQLNAYGYSAVAGDWFDMDDVMVTEGTTLHTYADGNASNWVWNGTVNRSTSTGVPI